MNRDPLKEGHSREAQTVYPCVPLSDDVPASPGVSSATPGSPGPRERSPGWSPDTSSDFQTSPGALRGVTAHALCSAMQHRQGEEESSKN